MLVQAMTRSRAGALLVKLEPWWDSQKIALALLLIFVVAAGVALWAAMLRQQVLSKTSQLQASLAAKRRAAKFDFARNQVLESIVANAPLEESMERLALAIEEQIPDSACAVVLPPDGKSFHGGQPMPVFIAPTLREDTHRQMVPALKSVFSSASGDDGKAGETDQEIVARLLQNLRDAGLPYRDGHMTVAFSGTGHAAGLILLFLRNEASPESEAVEQSVIESASRLVALAGDHGQMHARLLHEARHDALTGLPNRTVAEDRLEQALARADRARKIFAVFCVDLDGFKAINDERGHDAGDEILCGVSVRLRNSLRHSDTLARMGGDEFLVLIEDCAGESAAQSVAGSLIAALQQPFVLGGHSISISGSIGVAMYPADGNNAAQLRRRADIAMYRAKALGGSQVALSSGEVASAGRTAKKSFSS
jgi:diguanylate cyclase (GGDEF)-like protein